MNETTGRFAVWLVPEGDDRTFFAHTIRTLALWQNAALFEPHVTLFAGRRKAADRIDGIVTAAMKGLGPISLRTKGLDCTEDFFKTVFVEFEDDQRLVEMSRKIGEALAEPQGYDLHPHLSLIYKEMPEAEKRGIIRSLGPQKERVAFDELVVTSPGPTDDWRDVKTWAVECRLKLGPT